VLLTEILVKRRCVHGSAGFSLHAKWKWSDWQMIGNSFCVCNVRSLISLLYIFCLNLHDTSEAQINSSPDDLIEIFRVGDEAGGDTILFRNHEHAEVAVDNSGRFFVGGWQESPIIAFSEKGDFIGYVGGWGKAQVSSKIVVVSLLVQMVKFMCLISIVDNYLRLSQSCFNLAIAIGSLIL